MEQYIAYKDITFTINPWVCDYCSSIINIHPYYCKQCDNPNNIYSVLPEGNEYKNTNKLKRVEKVFGKKDKIILPVLACYSIEQFIENIKIMNDYYETEKISGIFILSTNIELSDFEIVYKQSKQLYPKLWIGVNLIGENIFKSLEFIKKYNPDGMWTDNSYLYNEKNIGICELILNQFQKYNWKGLYFGGVMFKYSKHCNNFNPEVIKLTNKYMDILTTSGDATGIEISEKKLDFINLNAENICIAIASGINENNIKKISEKANIFIVRSSIVDSNNNIELSKLDNLIINLY